MTAAERADALVDLGRPAQAVELLRQALAGDPEDTRLWCSLARAHLGADEPEYALGAADRALALGSGLGGADPAWGHRLRCVALRRLHRLPDAVAAGRAAVAADPQIWRNHLTLAETLLQEPRLALPADESPPAGALARARWDQTRGIRAGTAVLEVALKAAALAPDEADVHVCVAWAQVLRREHGQAQAAVERALALAPDNAAAHSARAHLLQRRGRFAGAASGFRRAAAIHPGGRAPAEFAAVCRRALHLGIVAAVLTWLFVGSAVADLAGQTESGLAGAPGLLVAAAFCVALFAPAAVVFARLPAPDRGLALRTVRRDTTLVIRFAALVGVGVVTGISGLMRGEGPVIGIAIVVLLAVALAAGPLAGVARRRRG